MLIFFMYKVIFFLSTYGICCRISVGKIVVDMAFLNHFSKKVNKNINISVSANAPFKFAMRGKKNFN